MQSSTNETPSKIQNPNLWKRCHKGQTDTELLALLRKCFERHIYLKYLSEHDIRKILMECFDICITKNNIRGFINHTSQEILDGILGRNLEPREITRNF